MYSLAEILVRLGIATTPLGTAATLLFLAAGLLIAWHYRRRDRALLLAFLSCISYAWTYHARHDFIVVLVPLTLLVFGSVTPGPALLSARVRAVGLVACLGVGVALLQVVYEGDPLVFRVLRWIGRLSLVVLLLLMTRLLMSDVSWRISAWSYERREAEDQSAASSNDESPTRVHRWSRT